MNKNTLDLIAQYINDNIDYFHTRRLEKIVNLKLDELLKRKNPYLFKAKDINYAPDLVTSILDAYLSSSEEEGFGRFLEGLAVYVALISGGGQKSIATGLDLEMMRNGIRYVISVKSGPHWGNSSQYKALKQNFSNAVKVLKQSRDAEAIQPVLGICYGKFRTTYNNLYMKIGGQNFWEFISDDDNLYIDIIEPLGYEAQKHNEGYLVEKANTYNRFTRQFMIEFCDAAGSIDWHKLVQFNSGNKPKPKALNTQKKKDVVDKSS